MKKHFFLFISLFTFLFAGIGFAQDSVNITINVNAANITVSPAGVFIAGGGTFGNPGDFALTDGDGDGTYSITVRKPRGFTSFYTFTNGACADYSCKENIAGQACANPGNFNDRKMENVQSDTTISTCFGSCTTDGTCPALQQPVNVTFQFDASAITVNGGIYMGANFDNWSGGIMLDDADGDMIYTVTRQLLPGNYEYKFINGANWAGPEQLGAEDSACTLTTGTFINRLVTVASTDMTVPVACWETCVACVTAIEGNLRSGWMQVAPVPASDRIALNFSEAVGQVRWEVLNQLGQTVLAGTGVELSVATLPNGVYQLRAATEAHSGVSRIVVAH